MLVFGVPIGMLLKRRTIDNIALLMIITLVIGSAFDLILYSRILTWCYDLENMGPISVSCSNFLTDIYATIPIGILGALIIIYLLNRRRQ